MLAELFAVGEGLVNYFEKDSIYQNRKDAQNRYVSNLKSLLIDNNEATTRLDSINDLFNTKITNDLNSSAVGNAISGILNPSVYSQLIPAKAQAIASTRNSIDEFNLNIGQKIAESSLMMDGIQPPGISDLAGGTISGYAPGLQIESMQKADTHKKRIDDWFGKTKWDEMTKDYGGYFPTISIG